MEMKIDKLRRWAAVCWLVVVAGMAFPQSQQGGMAAFREGQLRKIEQFRDTRQREIAAFRDSLNEVYASYLEQRWESFKLFRHERSFRLMPEPPVYDPSEPVRDEDSELPVVAEVPVTLPVPVDTVDLPVVTPVVPAPTTVWAEFFGTQVLLQRVDDCSISHLANASEDEVARFWRQLAYMPVDMVVNDLLRIVRELRLNGWGKFVLAREVAGKYILDASENERVVFAVFMLNQLGYGAKVGRSGQTLYAMLASNATMYTPYFTFHGGNHDGNMKYYVIVPDHKELTDIETCIVEFGGGDVPVDFAVAEQPRLADDMAEQLLQFGGDSYSVAYNRNLVRYYATCPRVDFDIYGTAPVDGELLNSLGRQLSPHIDGKSGREAVNYLLHLVQNAFRYKTDQDNYGYEKWNFAEETLVSAYSDCDDRAIFFAQLVRNLLGMKVVLVYYPGIHLATAVHFDEEIFGNYVTVDGEKFLICDPTYVNAHVGMAMPDVGTKVEIIKLF